MCYKKQPNHNLREIIYLYLFSWKELITQTVALQKRVKEVLKKVNNQMKNFSQKKSN